MNAVPIIEELRDNSPNAYLRFAVVGLFVWLYSYTGAAGAFVFDNECAYEFLFEWKNGFFRDQAEPTYEWLLFFLFVAGVTWFVASVPVNCVWRFSIGTLLQLTVASAILAALFSFELKSLNAQREYIAKFEAQGGHVFAKFHYFSLTGDWYLRCPLILGLWLGIFGVISFAGNQLSYLLKRNSAASVRGVEVPEK